LNSHPATRVGVYGGAFNPPHRGHHALAQTALDQLKLDLLYLLPTGQAWHKDGPLAPAKHRLAMTRLNFADLSHAVVDDREIQRPGPSYTVDTLSELKKQHPLADFFLLMGADQAAHFETWRDWQGIAQMAQLAVAPRENPDAAAARLPQWHNHSQIRVTLLQMPLEPVSATDIRLQIGKGSDPLQALHPAVYHYIQQHHLYMD
jgi:nicotinate-nucleotide adenylyltransferase